MNYSELYENKKRGSVDFPIELYHVDKNHVGYQMPLHWHLEYELMTVLEGSFELMLDCKKIVLNPGDCVWIGEGVVHGGIPKDCIYECIVFDLGTMLHDTPICSRSAAEFLADENGFTTVFKNNTPAADIAKKIFTTLSQEQKGYEWTVLGLIWQFMGMLLSVKPQALVLSNRTQINRLKNVLTYIKENFSNAITLNELAEIAGMSPRYFCRAFSQITGKTPIAYLNYYRIETAGEKLLTTSDRITNIGYSCGFNDSSYFSKMFFNEKGMTPSQYRRTKS